MHPDVRKEMVSIVSYTGTYHHILLYFRSDGRGDEHEQRIVPHHGAVPDRDFRKCAPHWCNHGSLSANLNIMNGRPS